MKRGWQIGSICIIGVLVLALTMVSCTSFSRRTYQALEISGVTYKQGYAAWKDLANQGVIDKPTFLQGKDLAIKYWSAWHMAQKAYESWAEVNSVPAEEKLVRAMTELAEVALEFVKYVNIWFPAEMDLSAEKLVSYSKAQGQLPAMARVAVDRVLVRPMQLAPVEE